MLKLLDPTIDYVFKRIFGFAGNEKITEGLLSAILQEPVHNINLDTNPIMERDLLDDKLGILDIKAHIGKDCVCDIEMQVVDKNNLLERLLFYWSKLYERTIVSGDDYIKLKKTIVIMFADFELKGFENIEKYVSQWNIREKDYVNSVLTDRFQLYIIEMPKFAKYRTNTELDTWVNFIKNPEVSDMSEKNESLKAAKKVLEDISQDEHEIYLAELREKYIRDQKAIQSKGYDNGVEAGMAMGLEQGISQRNEQIVRNMYEQNVSLEDIAKFTKLDIEEIKLIIQKLNK